MKRQKQTTVYAFDLSPRDHHRRDHFHVDKSKRKAADTRSAKSGAVSLPRVSMQSQPMTHHTIIPAPTRVIHIRPAERKVVVDMVVGITHTVASAGAALLFVAALVLTNL